MNRKLSLRSTAFYLILFFSVLSFSDLKAQFTLPEFTDWSNVNRISYNGNWLMNNDANGWAATPPIRTTLVGNTPNDGFGINDYNSDTNFTGIQLAKQDLSVIRVGRKFNQTGQGLITPARRAEVATFTFTPTATNCRVRVYYIGMLQDLTTLPDYFQNGLTNFRRDQGLPNSRRAAAFGLFCRYDYMSTVQNKVNLLTFPTPSDVSRTGRDEFNLSNYNATNNTFELPYHHTSYGLNDMYSFAKAGTNIRTVPASTATSLNKRMESWDSYVMDFSEFIGGTVTITLFSNTSNYPGDTQNHSYCYYQFESLQGSTPLPDSQLLNIPDRDFGCVATAPTHIPINITDTVPALLGTVTGPLTVQQVNNNREFIWLHIRNTLDRRYSNHFATLRVQLNGSNGEFSEYSNINYISFTNNTGTPNDIIINSLPATPTRIENDGTRVYTFRVFYSTRNNPSLVQNDTFDIRFRLLTPLPCNTPSVGEIMANGVIQPGNELTICKPNTINNGLQLELLPTINLTLGAAVNCGTQVTYRWQTRTISNPAPQNWVDTAVTTQNLPNAQNFVSTSSCVTEFRRMTITTETCGTNNIVTQTPSDRIFTIRNTGFVSLTGSTNITITDVSGVPNVIPPITLDSSTPSIMVCYGNTVQITPNFTFGQLNCGLPDLGTQVNIRYIANFNANWQATGFDNRILYDNEITFTGQTQISIPFTYQAVNQDTLHPLTGLNITGASGAVSIPISMDITLTRNGCTSKILRQFLIFQIFPRAIGGSIQLSGLCPQTVSNVSSVPTMSFDAYTWQYCTQYSGTAPNFTCTGDWQTIPGQSSENLPLALATIMQIPQPFIIKRTAQSGNNCGGVEDSNILEINIPQQMPNFSLPSFLCLGSTGITMPVASPTVQGTWHLVTSTNPPAFIPTPVTQLSASLAVGSYNYIFLPATSNAICFAPVLWSFNVQSPVNPGTLSGNNVLAPTDTSQLTASVSGGSWSSANPAVAIVNASGLVTAISNGTAVISYTVPGNCPATTSRTITVQNCAVSTTWNGTSWSNGVPNTPADINKAVIFNASYESFVDLYACSVLVQNNAIVRMKHIGDPDMTNTATTFTVKNEVTVTTGSTFEFEDDASLVQINNTTNTGNILYRRATPRVKKFDYVYWSSPVAGQALTALTEAVNPGLIYHWNTSINNWSALSNTTIMQTGKGYIVRAPNSFDTQPQPQRANFNGVANNGTLTTPVANNGNKMNLIGNPYPSGIDINCFLADPVNANLGGAIYLWAHNIPIDWTGSTQQGLPGSAIYNYNINSYAAYNRLGGVGTGIVNILNNEFLTDRSLGKVAAGQSFFIEANIGGVATFKNNMRVGSSNQENSQFYRTTTLAPAETSNCIQEERHRLWLQIRNTTAAPQQFKQTLVGYATNATTSTLLDRDYDAKTFVAEPITINLYTLSPVADKLTIQGRAVTTPFNVDEVIPIGFTCKRSGSGPNTIQFAASEFDGLFNNTNFWLRETQPDGSFIYYDIKTAPYNFELPINTPDIIDNTTRFALVFSTTTPRLMNPDTNFSVIASPNPYTNGFQLHLTTTANDEVKVEVYDVLGKLVEKVVGTKTVIENYVLGKGLSDGFYTALVTQGNTKEVVKIIKR